MSWRPRTVGPPPPHRIDRYAFRAGELRGPDGRTTGHALVLPMIWWRQTGGYLWWRRWSDPYVSADVWVRAEGVGEAYTDAWASGDHLDEELDHWDSGELTVGPGIRHAVRWLDHQTSVAIARQLFDADLDALRAERMGER